MSRPDIINNKSERVKLTKEFLINEHYNLRKCVRRIAEETGYSAKNIRYYFNKYNITNKTYEIYGSRRFTGEIELTYDYLYQQRVIQNKNIYEISQDSGWCKSWVHNKCKEYKLEQSQKRKVDRSASTTEIPTRFWGAIRAGAKNRDLEFKIDKKYIYNLLKLQKFRCALTNQELILTNDLIKNTASLDRINSKIGYLEGNLQWLHRDINKMKWAFEEKYFIHMCTLVTNFRGQHG